MNINTDELFPDGLSNKTASVISELLNDIAMQWDSAYYLQIRDYQKQLEADLYEYDPQQPWIRKLKNKD